MKIVVPMVGVEVEILIRWEKYLGRCGYRFKKKGTNGNYEYHIEVKEAQDAFWLGCNNVSLLHKLFDGPLTKTLTG